MPILILKSCLFSGLSPVPVISGHDLTRKWTDLNSCYIDLSMYQFLYSAQRGIFLLLPWYSLTILRHFFALESNFHNFEFHRID